MARISKIDFELNGERLVVNVNCNSAGIFTIKLPDTVRVALNLRSEISATSLGAAETEFHNALKRYKQAETRQDVLIAIRYRACGEFVWEAGHKRTMFNQHQHTAYQLDMRWGGACSAIAFDHHVIIRETIDGVINYFNAIQGKAYPFPKAEHEAEPERWFKRDKFGEHEKHRLIPYSDIAWQTLQGATEKLRQISEGLFRFIDQDNEAIEEILTKTKLLK